MPGKVADVLRAAGLEPAERAALDGGQGVPAVPAQRKARREYEIRVSAHAPIGP
ncbi:hypothetical protein [Streptomyces sp. NBC_01187]|uniref:hypothetical protein n=1 Tax=Streptomyces sp. NBC_01187 TaxID=2903766 RepID=UPI0038679DC2|nr:hypothetical protein OG220_36160 [Streptomyces sp. NBC_01187]